MRVFILIFIFFSFCFGADKINIMVSVLPQAYFVKKIAGDYANVSVIVPDGRSPETYEPLPSQIKLIKKASLYLGVGMEFEKIWRDRFAGVNPTMKFLDLSKDLNLSNTAAGNQNDDHHMKHDPHIWVSVKLAKIQAQKIYAAISQVDISRSSIYKANLEKFLKEIDGLDVEIKSIFSKPGVQKTFVVYHPAFGYLAREYGLEEVSLENDGKSPKAKQMIALRKLIQQKNIRVLYIQPQFSKKRIMALANELNLKVLELNPLAKDWEKNILHICKMIATQGNEVE